MLKTSAHAVAVPISLFSNPTADFNSPSSQPALTGLSGQLNRFSPIDNKNPHLMPKAHRR
jgi:hypothetical protein